jgi:restriction endonuclease S subunit
LKGKRGFNPSFVVKKEELEGRWDPYYHQPKFVSIAKELESISYPIKKLEEITNLIIDAPHERSQFSDEGILCIMIEDLKEWELELKSKKYITTAYHSKLKKTQVVPNDLLMVRIGVTTGVTSIVPPFITQANISGNITRIVCNKDEVNPKYVVSYINSRIGMAMVKRIMSTTARDFLTIDKIKSVKIPLPPLPTQQKIVSRVQSLLEEAKRLKEEAKKVVDQAKEEVERIIVGGK